MAGKAIEVVLLGSLLLVLLLLCAKGVLSKPATDEAGPDGEPAHMTGEGERPVHTTAWVDEKLAQDGEVDGFAHTIAKRHSNYEDPRWRLITGLIVLRLYSRRLESNYINTPPMIHINYNSPNHTILENIFTGICNLLDFHELAVKMNSSGCEKFNLVLAEVMRDSCNWIKYLVNHTNALIITDPGHFIDNTSCTDNDITVIHQYCFRARVSKIRSMITTGDSPLHEDAKGYHFYDEHHVAATNVNVWLNTTSVPIIARESIYRDTVMAILQYIIDMDLIQL